ncbi:MAG TPA: hypothetical protein VFS60_04800 [Thermoanaerobaculia bacterium]|nr:hypothetical protein [Thermoanaerobaculia bacterium]
MRHLSRLALVLALGLALQTAAQAGGLKCPPRFGVIAASGSDVVFIDAADSHAYQLSRTEGAREHVGHRVKIVAHVIAGTSDTLYVHTLQCLNHESG